MLLDQKNEVEFFMPHSILIPIVHSHDSAPPKPHFSAL
jgi:hypothetical protein